MIQSSCVRRKPTRVLLVRVGERVAPSPGLDRANVAFVFHKAVRDAVRLRLRGDTELGAELYDQRVARACRRRAVRILRSCFWASVKARVLANLRAP